MKSVLRGTRSVSVNGEERERGQTDKRAMFVCKLCVAKTSGDPLALVG